MTIAPRRRSSVGAGALGDCTTDELPLGGDLWPLRGRDRAEDKLASLRAFIDGLYPWRWDTLRPINDKIPTPPPCGIALDEASAKVRDWGVKDDEGRPGVPVWAA